MRRHSGADVVALPFAAALFALLGVAASPARGGSDQRVALEVAGVLPLQDEGASLVVLREKGAETILPVLVPGSAGRNVASQLRGNRAGVPPTDLLGGTIAALGARVEEVEIETSTESAHGARVRLRQGGRALDLEGRPSEGIALAVGSGAPLLARRRLLERDGLSKEDLEQLRQAQRDPKSGEMHL
jgi:bifunctional DNase/RNase